jgi:hypothetical protein
MVKRLLPDTAYSNKNMRQKKKKRWYYLLVKKLMYVKVICSELGSSAVPPYHMLLGCTHRINNREKKLEREMVQKGQCPELLHIEYYYYYYYNHHRQSVICYTKQNLQNWKKKDMKVRGCW